jgi:hypothetical protein
MAGLLARGVGGGKAPTPDYNLFQRIQEPDFYCAVAQDKPVPPFVTSDLWQFVGSGPEVTGHLLACRNTHVWAGDQLDGFYLFYAGRNLERPALREMDEAA